MRTTIIAILLFGIISAGVATGGLNYLMTPSYTDNVQVEDEGRYLPSDEEGYYYGEITANLTTEEAIQIATVHPGVAEIVGDKYDVEAFYDGYGIWYVDFFLETDVLEVLVDDFLEEVIDYYYIGFYEEPLDPELVDELVEFVESHELFAEVNLEQFTWDAWGDDEYVTLWGYAEMDWAQIAIELADPYLITSVTATIEFGDPALSAEDAIQVVSNSTEGKNFMDNVTSYSTYSTLTAEFLDGTSYTYYIELYEDWDEGYDYGIVEPAYGSSWASFIVDGMTGTLIDSWSYVYTPPQSNETEVLQVASAEIGEWASSAGSYEGYAYYDGMQWYASFYATGMEAWAEVTVEDGSLKVLDVVTFLPPPSTRSAGEVLQIAMDNGLGEFINSHDFELSVMTYYTSQSTWYVFAWSDIYLEVYWSAEIEDSTGVVLWAESGDFEVPPTKSSSQVLEVVHNMDEYQDFIRTNNATEYLYYYGGVWYVDLVDWDTFNSLTFAYDDMTGKIEVYSYEGGEF